jgi:TonB family protein
VVSIGANDIVDVVMSADVSSLSEVVVTATGIEREKRSLGYSVSKTKKVRRQKAEPIIGFEAYTLYLTDSLQYPLEAMENSVSGTVVVQVIVAADGGVRDIQVLEGLGYGCDEEAIRLVQDGPQWQSAIRRGESVRESVRLKVVFNN